MTSGKQGWGETLDNEEPKRRTRQKEASFFFFFFCGGGGLASKERTKRYLGMGVGAEPGS